MNTGIFSKAFFLMKKAFSAFQQNDPFTLAGALAYFTIFAIPPILVILISIVGYIAGQQTAKQELYSQIQALWGEQGTKIVRTAAENYAINEQGTWQKILAIGILVYSASSFFAVIQSSLNTIWGVRPKPGNSLLKMILNRALSFVIILVLGALLVTSLILESLLVSIQGSFDQLLPGISPLLFGVLGYAISFLLLVLVFAIIYKFLPDAAVRWKVVWTGAIITAFLFTVGRFAISFYLSQSSMSDAYGVAGALILILLWIFYSALILFFGAEVTQQYALYFGHDILPKEHAVRVKEQEIPREEIVASQNLR